jgi:undecaprenyl-diphosphatase
VLQALWAQLAPLEARLLLAIHAEASPLLDRLFLISHDLGTVLFFAPLVLGLAFWHLHRGEQRLAGLWGLVGLSTWALQEGLKQLVARPRPDLWPRLVEVGPYSFPSGHALASATFFPLLAWDLTRASGLRARWLAVSAAALLSVSIGLGRLYLGVHWPSDVVVGWGIGSLQCLAAARKLRLREG